MKKILLSLAAVMTFGFANAATATFDFANGEWGTTTPEEITAPANGEKLNVEHTVFTTDGVSLSFEDMTMGAASMMNCYVNLVAIDGQYQLNVDDVFYTIIKVPEGGSIKDIYFDSDNLINVYTFSSPGFDSTIIEGSISDGTWTPAISGLSQVCFMLKGYSEGPIDIKALTVNYSTSEVGDDKDTVATPVFNPAEGGAIDGIVTISCATEGATIYYTTDGTDPVVGEENTIEYTQPVTISETVIIKAIAVLEGMNDSEVASATFYPIDAPEEPEGTFVTFPFNSAEWWTSNNILLPESLNNENEFSTADNPVSFTEGCVTVTFTKARVTGTPNLSIRQPNTFTVSCNDKNRLERIVLTLNPEKTAPSATYAQIEGGDKVAIEGNMWTAEPETEITSVTFSFSGVPFIETMNVFYATESGVEGLESENIAPVYYNLQGVRVANPEKGLYIVVKGNKTSKVIF